MKRQIISVPTGVLYCGGGGVTKTKIQTLVQQQQYGRRSAVHMMLNCLAFKNRRRVSQKLCS